MPKVISRAAVSSSDQAPETASSQAILRSFYCLCGDFVLVIDRGLESLPRRKTDGAYIIRSKDGRNLPAQAARKFKLNAVAGKRCLVKRKGQTALEPRVPLLCSRCSTPVGYQAGPMPIGSGMFVYMLKGGITEQQGRVPNDAFDGEDDVREDETLQLEGGVSRQDAREAVRAMEAEAAKRGKGRGGMGEGIEIMEKDDRD